MKVAQNERRKAAINARLERVRADALKTWRGFELHDLRNALEAWPGSGAKINALQFAQVMAMHAEGIPLQKACDAAKVKYSTLLRKSIASDVLSDVFHRARACYIQARVDAMEQIVEEAGKQYDNHKLRNVEINRARLHCDNIKWLAERVLRRVYGHYLEVNARSDVAVQFQVVGLSSGPGLPRSDPNDTQMLESSETTEG